MPLLRGHPIAEEVEEGAGVVGVRGGAVVEAHGGERMGGAGGGGSRRVWEEGNLIMLLLRVLVIKDLG